MKFCKNFLPIYDGAIYKDGLRLEVHKISEFLAVKCKKKVN